MDEHRTHRVSEAMREEMAELIGYEMSDPRVAGVSVVEVHVSPDLRHAQVMLTADTEIAGAEEVLEALEGARGFLRRELAVRLELHRMPDLHFALEPVAGGSRLGRLMKRIRKGRPREAEAAGDENKPVE
ncbi:MAG: 30S ribosome-binding factor RbfA [Acidobacteria bacterium]|nr:30S ribosome-binding factor RbfA [Acidobacteriota bacterium]